MYFEIYNSKSLFSRGKWRWRLKDKNHEVIAHGEGYRNRSDCIRAVSLVSGTSNKTPVKWLDL